MCNLSEERHKLEEILMTVLRDSVFDVAVTRSSLMERSLSALREHYQDKCPDECIVARCEEYLREVSDSIDIRILDL